MTIMVIDWRGREFRVTRRHDGKRLRMMFFFVGEDRILR
jgi:hypothetical protein